MWVEDNEVASSCRAVSEHCLLCTHISNSTVQRGQSGPSQSHLSNTISTLENSNDAVYSTWECRPVRQILRGAKSLLHSPVWPEFSPWNTCKGGKREQTPKLPSDFHPNTLTHIHSFPTLLFLTHNNDKQIVFKWEVPNWLQVLDLALLTRPLADDQTTEIW